MSNLKRKHRYLLSTLSGVLMVVSFPYTGSLLPLIFFSWVPILLVEENIARSRYKSGKVFIHAFIAFFLFNIGSTWWVWNASAGGASLAIGLNSLFMAIIFYFFHLTKKYVGTKEGYLGLIIFWIAFEYFHHNWEMSWTWLSIGNAFSRVPSIVQWYSYSGILGGTLWVLLLNLLSFRIIQNVFVRKETWSIQTPLLILLCLLYTSPSPRDA